MKSARQMSFFNKQDTAAKPSALKFFVDMGTVGYSKRYYMNHIHEQNKTSLANTKQKRSHSENFISIADL
jgi:hypothetical protein